MGDLPGRTLANRDKTKSMEVIGRLAELVTADDIAVAIHGALKATTITWETGADGKKVPVTVPDHRLRLEGGKLALSYFVGNPIQRQEIVTQEVKNNGDEAMARLMASPAARAELQRMLDEAGKSAAIDV